MSSAAKKAVTPQGEASVADVADLLDEATQTKIEGNNANKKGKKPAKAKAAEDTEVQEDAVEVEEEQGDALVAKGRKGTREQLAHALKKAKPAGKTPKAANDNEEDQEGDMKKAVAEHAAAQAAAQAAVAHVPTPVAEPPHAAEGAHDAPHDAPHDVPGAHGGGTEKKGPGFFSSLFTTLGRITRTVGIGTDATFQLGAGTAKWYRSHPKPLGGIVADVTPGPIRKGLNWLFSKFGLGTKNPKSTESKYNKDKT